MVDAARRIPHPGAARAERGRDHRAPSSSPTSSRSIPAPPGCSTAASPSSLAFDERFSSLLPVDRTPAPGRPRRADATAGVGARRRSRRTARGCRCPPPTGSSTTAARRRRRRPWVPRVIDDVLVQADVRRAPTLNPFARALEALELLSPSCGLVRRPPALVADPHPRAGRPAGASDPTTRCGRPRTTLRAAVRRKVRPARRPRRPFEDGDETALTVADEGRITSTGWQVADGMLGGVGRSGTGTAPLRRARRHGLGPRPDPRGGRPGGRGGRRRGRGERAAAASSGHYWRWSTRRAVNCGCWPAEAARPRIWRARRCPPDRLRRTRWRCSSSTIASAPGSARPRSRPTAATCATVGSRWSSTARSLRGAARRRARRVRHPADHQPLRRFRRAHRQLGRGDPAAARRRRCGARTAGRDHGRDRRRDERRRRSAGAATAVRPLGRRAGDPAVADRRGSRLGVRRGQRRHARCSCCESPEPLPFSRDVRLTVTHRVMSLPAIRRPACPARTAALRRRPGLRPRPRSAVRCPTTSRRSCGGRARSSTPCAPTASADRVEYRIYRVSVDDGGAGPDSCWKAT